MSRVGPPHTTAYVHVPFCVVKCGYCDFNSYAVDSDEPLDVFLDALQLELDMLQLDSRPATVFIGGGTPTYLDEARLERLLRMLAKAFDLQGCPEVTMEANPESVTRAKADIARQAGVNRISIGAQTFDAERLRFLDRAHSGDQTALPSRPFGPPASTTSAWT